MKLALPETKKPAGKRERGGKKTKKHKTKFVHAYIYV